MIQMIYFFEIEIVSVTETLNLALPMLLGQEGV